MCFCHRCIHCCTYLHSKNIFCIVFSLWWTSAQISSMPGEKALWKKIIFLKRYEMCWYHVLKRFNGNITRNVINKIWKCFLSYVLLKRLLSGTVDFFLVFHVKEYYFIRSIDIHLHWYLWLSFATPPFRSLLPVGLQGYIPYWHRNAVCNF